MYKAIFSFISLTIREVIRSKSYGFILLFALITSSTLTFFSGFTAQEQEKFLIDISFSCLTLFSLIIAITLGALYIHSDIENKNILALHANPIRMGAYLMGRFLGFALLIALGMVIMQFLFYAVLALQKIQFTQAVQSEAGSEMSKPLLHSMKSLLPNSGIFKVILSILFQNLVICAISIFFSTCFSVSMAITGSIFIFGLGHLLEFIQQISFQYNETAGHILKFLFLPIPNLENFNIKDSLVLGHEASALYIFWLGIYSVICIATYLVLSHRSLHAKLAEL
jgi:hypothetical protein